MIKRNISLKKVEEVKRETDRSEKSERKELFKAKIAWTASSPKNNKSANAQSLSNVNINA